MTTDDSIAAWGNHVDGAVALTKMRGTDQFRNPMSHAVFRAVRTTMVTTSLPSYSYLQILTECSKITSCVQRSKPISAFPSQNGWIAHEMSDENAANRLTLICIDLPNIRARACVLTSTPFDIVQAEEAKSIMALAEMVDANLHDWYQTLPPEWHYRTVAMVYEMPDDVSEAESWIGPQHAYHDVSLASLVNDYRVCRIFCQRVIMACVSWLSCADSIASYADSYNRAVYVIQEMVDEISACVTFHMCYDMQPVAKELALEKNGKSEINRVKIISECHVDSD